MAVRLADINFGSKDGAAVALDRIEAAASVVCGGEPNLRDLYRRGLYADCRRIAIREAVRDLNQPLLSGLVGPSLHSVEQAAAR